MTGRTTLYRFFDSFDQLLYVGIGGNPGRRFDQHAKGHDAKPWWSQVAGSTMEHFDTRDEALAAEKHAIQTEAPLYNVVHNARPGQPDRCTRPQVPPGAGWDGWKHDDECLGAGPMYFRSRWGQCRHDDLYLAPELHLSPCVDDVYGWSEDPVEQGHIEVEYWLGQLRSSNGGRLPGRVHIHWGLYGSHTAETAPLGEFWGNKFLDLGDFLTHFSHPIDARTNSRINFLRLPIKHRFERFAAALGWQPSPLQQWCPVGLLATPETAQKRSITLVDNLGKTL